MTTPSLDSPAQSRGPLAAGLAVGIAGSIALRVALFLTCPSFTSAYCHNSDLVPIGWLAGAMLGLVALYAIFSRTGIRFALAFVVTIGAIGLVNGAMRRLWSAPVSMVLKDARPIAPTRLIVTRLSHDTKAEWIATMSAQTLEPIHGVRMARLLQRCVEDYRGVDSVGSYPRTADAITLSSDCGTLVNDRVDLSGDATRYTMPADHGFRWHYSTGAMDSVGRVRRYVITVEPDSLLHKPGPVYLTDNSGLLVERAVGGGPLMVAGNPVAFLNDIRPCIAQLPAERIRRKARTSYYYREPTPFEAAASVCPDISIRLRQDDSGDGVTVSFPIHEHHGEFYDTAAVYHVAYRAIDEAGATFELRATPVPTSHLRAGLRRYLLAADGTVHVTRMNRDASSYDPAASACEADPNVPCVR